jgi:hypothetical protein
LFNISYINLIYKYFTNYFIIMSTNFLYLTLIGTCLGDCSHLSTGSLSGYLTPNDVANFVSSLPSVYNKSLGNSYLKNSTPAYYTSLVSYRPYILITGGHTTSQPLSVTMVLYLLDTIVSATSSDPNYGLYQYLMQNYNLYFIPMINIDAYTQMAKSKNLTVYLKNFNNQCA